MAEISDATPNSGTMRTTFTDAAAIQFPAEAGSEVPFICMGQADQAVNIWQWRGDQQLPPSAPVDGGYVDLYPFEDDLYYTARQAGNPLSQTDRLPVQNLVAPSAHDGLAWAGFPAHGRSHGAALRAGRVGGGVGEAGRVAARPAARAQSHGVDAAERALEVLARPDVRVVAMAVGAGAETVELVHQLIDASLHPLGVHDLTSPRQYVPCLPPTAPNFPRRY